MLTEFSRVIQPVSAKQVVFLHSAPHKNQRGLKFWAFALIYGPALSVLAVTSWANSQGNVPIGFFSRDPSAALNGHPLTGIQSTLGVLVWCTAAGICFFSCRVLHGTQGNKTLCSFLLWSGVVTSVLALDDMFLVHEDLAHRYLALNEKVIFLAYGSIVAWYLVKFRKNIFDAEYLLLFLAFAFFGSSIVVDFFQNKWSSPWRIFFEDGFKLLGIVSWSGYLIRICFHAVSTPLNLPLRSAGVLQAGSRPED